MRAVWASSVPGRRPAGAHAGVERCPGWRSLPDAEQSARDAAGHALDGGAGRPRVEDASHDVLGLALVPAPEGAADDLLAVLFATSGALYPTMYQTRALTPPRRCRRREWLGPLLTGAAPTPACALAKAACTAAPRCPPGASAAKGGSGRSWTVQRWQPFANEPG